MTWKYVAGELPAVTCTLHPEWETLYNTAWEMAFTNIEYPDGEGWKPQLTCMPGMGKTWQWDSCFMTLFARYGQDALQPMNNLDNLYRLQREDGFFAMAYCLESGLPAFDERINPPLFAWVEWEYFRVTGDASRFPRVFPSLVRYFDWLKRHRTRNSGLYWFDDPGASGMDNAPRGAYFSPGQNGSDMCHVDLACQQALAADRLARIATWLGRTDDAKRFLDEAESLRRLTNHYHWCEKTGFYYDVFLRDDPDLRHNMIPSKTIAAFWALLAGCADENRQRRLIDEHLLNPDEFATLHPVPALSRDDPNYDPMGGYWNGGVWPPANHMIARGLIETGHRDVARRLIAAHLTAMAQVFENPSSASIWEAYAPEYFRPANTEHANEFVRRDFVGWGGLGPIAGLLEAIMGLECDAGANTLHWHVPPSDIGDIAIRRLPFNGGRIDAIRSVGPATARIVCERPMTVILSVPGKQPPERHAISAGDHVFDLTA